MKATFYPSRHSPVIPNQKILFSGVCAFLGKDINSDFWRFWIWFSWRWQLQSIKLYFVNSNQQRLDSVLICFFHCFAFSIVYSSLIRFVFSGIFKSDIIWDALDASRINQPELIMWTSGNLILFQIVTHHVFSKTCFALILRSLIFLQFSVWQ